MNDSQPPRVPKLEQDAQVRKVSWMVPNEGPLKDQDRDEILFRAQAHLREYGLSQADVAHALGENEAYISWLFNRNDKLPVKSRDKLLRGVNNWIEDDYRRRQVQRPPNYVETKAAEHIIDTVENVRVARLLGILTGGAGLGKTTCLKVLAAEIPGTIYVPVDPDTAKPNGLLDALIEGARVRKRGQRRPRFKDLVDRLRGSDRLIIIDDAQRLKDAAIVIVANLWDQCHTPILLCGTRDIHDRLRDDRDPEFGQLSSRVGWRTNLQHELYGRTPGGKTRKQWVSPADIRKIFERKIKIHPDVLRMLADMANEPCKGHLRRIEHIMIVAEGIVRADRTAGGVLQVRHLDTAKYYVKGYDESEPAVSADPPQEQKEAATG